MVFRFRLCLSLFLFFPVSSLSLRFQRIRDRKSTRRRFIFSYNHRYDFRLQGGVKSFTKLVIICPSCSFLVTLSRCHRHAPQNFPFPSKSRTEVRPRGWICIKIVFETMDASRFLLWEANTRSFLSEFGMHFGILNF